MKVFKEKAEFWINSLLHSNVIPTGSSIESITNELLQAAYTDIKSKIDPETIADNYKETVLRKEANGFIESLLVKMAYHYYKLGIKHCLDEIELKAFFEKG